MDLRYYHDENSIEIEKFREVAAFFGILYKIRENRNQKPSKLSLNQRESRRNLKNGNFLAFLVLKTPTNDDILLKY